MRIGVITTSFPRFEGDGAGRFVLEHSLALARAGGHAIEVIAPEPREGSLPTGLDGFEVHWVPYLRPRSIERTFYGAGTPENLARDPWAWLGIVPFVAALDRAIARRAHRWDAIVSHWALPCGLVAGRHARGRPHLAVFHSADVTALRHSPPAVHAAIARGATALQFVCDAHRTSFCSRLRSPSPPVWVAPMGIAGRERVPARSGPVRTLLSMGRLVPIKGLHRAIDAIAELDATLVIAGDGPERAALEAHARARGAQVEFTGPVFGRAREELFRRADAFVLPSGRSRFGREEGVPHSMLEAMIRSLPVIATRTGGIGEVVRDGVEGLLVAPGDARGLRAAIEHLASDPPLARAMGENARTRARGFTWDAQAAALHTLLFGEPPASLGDDDLETTGV
jgi:glycosyltransferase involved in cell wall biosynthesis